MTHTPYHLVIIPDGNRRWATNRSLPVWEGHEAGARNFRGLVEEAMHIGVTHVSFWGSSLDNLTKRSIQETRALLGIYTKYFTEILEKGDREPLKARIHVCGRWRTQFPQQLVKLIERCEKETAQFTEHTLTLFLAYNGDDDMLQAIQQIVAEGIAPEAITPDVVKKHLFTHDLPPVDFMIRTGGEPHLSNGFLMWDTANAHLLFTETLFPDFTPEMLRAAITDVQGRTNRRGS